MATIQNQKTLLLARFPVQKNTRKRREVRA